MARRRFRTLRFALVLSVLCACGVAKTSQSAQDPKEVLLTLTREDLPPVGLTATDFGKLTRQKVNATDHEQNITTFEGVSGMSCSLLPCRSERS